MTLTFATDDADAIDLFVISSDNLDAIPATAQAWQIKMDFAAQSDKR